MHNRKGIGGRKPVVIPNPFVVYEEEWEDDINLLWDTEGDVDVRIEDTLVGCIRIFDADRKVVSRQSLINWVKLLRVYRNCNELTRQNVQAYLSCSESQAKRYIRVIKFANPFIKRVLAHGTKIKYPNVTSWQAYTGCPKITGK